jgi:hypothetical protein
MTMRNDPVGHGSVPDADEPLIREPKTGSGEHDYARSYDAYVGRPREESVEWLRAHIALLEALLREATAEKWVPTFDWWQRVRAALGEKP